jgi:hypothetical protein
MFRQINLSHLIYTDPAALAEMIVREFKSSKCLRLKTAEKLGIDKRTLARYIDKLELEPKLAEIETKALRDGWHHGNFGGRPLGSKDTHPRVKSTKPVKRAAKKAA